jgi:hypothetical protein
MHHPRPVHLFVGFILIIAATALAAPDDDWTATYHPQMDISRTTGEIEIDGLLDDAGWSG